MATGTKPWSSHLYPSVCTVCPKSLGTDHFPLPQSTWTSEKEVVCSSFSESPLLGPRVEEFSSLNVWQLNFETERKVYCHIEVEYISTFKFLFIICLLSLSDEIYPPLSSEKRYQEKRRLTWVQGSKQPLTVFVSHLSL